MLKPCHKCVHYVFVGKSLNYDVGRCNLFKTFAELSRLTTCGKEARNFKDAFMCLKTTNMRKEW